MKQSTPATPDRSAPRDQLFVVAAAPQMRALVSPVRQEIVDALVAAGPCSIADLAAHVGRAPDSLYFHIRRLVKVGLVLELNERATGRRPAAVYDVPGRPMRLAYTRAGRDPALAGVMSSALRLAGRDFSRAFRLGVAVVDGERRNLWGGRVKGWVGDEELAEINRLVTRLTEIIRSGHPGPGRLPQTFTYILAPVRPSKRAARPSPSGVRSKPTQGVEA